MFLSLLLLACPLPGDSDSGLGGWNGGQTGSESAGCDDAEITPLGGAETDAVAGVEGEWELTFTWEDWSTEAMTLTVAPFGDLLEVSSEKCGDSQRFEAEVDFVLEGGAFVEHFTATVEKVDRDNAVFEIREDIEVQGSYGEDVTFYCAFPDEGPTGTVTADALVGRW